MPFDGTSKESGRTRILRDARDRISDENRWTRGRLLDDQGRSCALGALGGVYGGSFSDTDLPLGALIVLLAKHASYRGHDACNGYIVTDRSHACVKVAGHNNMLGHAATMQMFDAAIAESVQLDLVS